MSACKKLDSEESIRPPFEIEFAAKKLDLSPTREALAIIFDHLEDWGLRALIGWVGSLVLASIGVILLQF